MDSPYVAFTDPRIAGFTIQQPLNVTFTPQPDITAYELAQILPMLIGGQPIYEGEWTNFDPALKRHLKRVE